MGEVTGGIKFYERINGPYDRHRVRSTPEGGTSSSWFVDRLNLLIDNPILASVGDFDAASEISYFVNYSSDITFDTIICRNIHASIFRIFISGLRNKRGFNNDTRFTDLVSNITNEAFYLTFDEKTTNQIFVSVRRRTELGSRQYVGQMLVLKEIGTLEGFPNMRFQSSRNETRRKNLREQNIIIKERDSIRINLDFRNYPSENDIKLIEQLSTRSEPFYIYPCGGRKGSEYFKPTQIGVRPSDIFKVLLSGQKTGSWQTNSYLNGVSLSVRFEEVI